MHGRFPLVAAAVGLKSALAISPLAVFPLFTVIAPNALLALAAIPPVNALLQNFLRVQFPMPHLSIEWLPPRAAYSRRALPSSEACLVKPRVVAMHISMTGGTECYQVFGGIRATPKECRENVLDSIAAEIQRLSQFKKKQSEIEDSRTEIEKLRQGVPDTPALDRLMRYEGLERAFDRTLSQLERAQRLRMGQMVPPALRVELGSSETNCKTNSGK
jgi:hypothetical protein